MPFITLYLPRGCDDGALETSMREITAAGAELLENTLQRMIRVTVLEADPERVYQGGAQAEKLAPTVLFRVGPGRSAGAKDAFMDQIASILSRNQAQRLFKEGEINAHHVYGSTARRQGPRAD